MAKTNEQFDQHFREKLEGHREKPSALAWERLESQLPKESKSTFGIWWAIAASVTALLVASYLFWPREEGLSEENLMATKTELPEVITPKSTEQAETLQVPTPQTEEKTETTIPSSQPEEKPATNTKTKPTPAPALTQAPQNLIAKAENPQTVSPKSETIPELKTEELQVTIPELKTPEIQKTVAEAKPQTEDEPLYRVSIYSDGVKKGEPANKNLITELGKTVGQVEGLLGKVDDGLISIQDKKDNLFATLTSKKSQADEKP
ncbi:hypothetical protein D0X99_05725 [Algoriphagus lacus]|uniref:Uncharacterized protein n=1 Tax=Algoriphagus lacus TaxID=2056311 RepID=A0A418PUL5_9BACT|nr:hypothetical protein [Algoriphagus lacus]RIW17245.1 hypothetical protein D0X99_05725 [Algoriphagus lacus]